jgi:hypothetical protein
MSALGTARAAAVTALVLAGAATAPLGCSAASPGSSAVGGAGGGASPVGVGGDPGAGGTTSFGGSVTSTGGDSLGGVSGAQGTGSATGSECASVKQTAKNTLQPADIIMAVDNGPNMQTDITIVRDRLDGFSKQIVASGVDANIVLITAALNPDIVSQATPLGGSAGGWRAICVGAPLGSGKCPDDSNPPSFHHLDEEVGAGHGLIPTPERHPLNLFTQLYPKYKAFLRPNAAKSFVVITDQNATPGPNDSAAAFTSAVAAMDPVMFPSFRMSGIVAYTACLQFLFPSVVGTVYLDLIKQTGGVSGDFCTSNFAPVFDDLAKGVIGYSQVDCQWAIPPAPGGQTLDPRKVNVKITSGAVESQIGQVSSAADCARAGDGWYYDSPTSPSMIMACPASCDTIRKAQGSQVDVLFGCETVTAVLR